MRFVSLCLLTAFRIGSWKVNNLVVKVCSNSPDRIPLNLDARALCTKMQEPEFKTRDLIKRENLASALDFLRADARLIEKIGFILVGFSVENLVLNHRNSCCRHR